MPGWLQLIGGIAPILLMLSLGVAIFGYLRLKSLMGKRDEDKAEEERRRKEFLAKMQPKIEKLKKS